MNDTEIVQIVCSKLDQHGPGKWGYYDKKVAQGVEFKFVALDAKIGYKFREDTKIGKGYVQRAFNRQKLAYSLGLAPPPLKLLNMEYRYKVGNEEKLVRYNGYVTALATNVGEADVSDVAYLEYKFHEKGLAHFAFDLGAWNMGRYNNDWVGIDFGDVSVDE